MKTAIIALTLLLTASTVQAQNFNRQSQVQSRIWYYETYGDYGYYGYGYGYPRISPFGRYQQYVPPQQFYPGSIGVIPGSFSNGYFLPNYYGW